MKNLIIIMILVIVTISCAKDDNSVSKKGNSEKVMMLMHMPMMEQEFQITNNPDIDYLYNMIPHHKGAVVSSEEYLKTGKNKMVKRLASNIIKAQNKEIKEFQQVITRLNTKLSKYDKKAVAKISKDSQKAMNGMMKEMNAVKISGDIDKDYLMGMIPHHQGAIDTSKIILTITKDETVKEIANRIIADQKKEIADINAMLKAI